MVEFALAVVPSAGVLFLFWLGIRSLLAADRRERLAEQRLRRRADDEREPGATG